MVRGGGGVGGQIMKIETQKSSKDGGDGRQEEGQQRPLSWRPHTDSGCCGLEGGLRLSKQ